MKFNYKGNIDVKEYIDSLDVSLIPDEGQIDEIMKKSLTKSFLTLKTLSKEEKISKGDTVIFEIVSTITKFNKPKLMVVVGNGLYDKTVEENMIGMCTGDKKEISINDTLVTFTILEVKRKDVPEISIDMVKAQNVENVETIEQYREHLEKQLMDNTIFPMVGQMVENIIKDIPFDEPEEEKIKILGELEADFFRVNNFRMISARDGIELHIDFKNDMSNIATNVYETNKIISNLLQNAIDETKTHTDKSYGIWLYILKRGEFCVIHVANKLKNDIVEGELMKDVYKQGYTTKDGHSGIGLSSIYTLSLRYRGIVYTRLEGDIVHFIAKIPFNI